jgi:hypothetical protein
MITAYTINATTWTAITTAGQSGTCWLNEDNDGAGGAADCRISHSDSGAPSLDTSKRVYKPQGNTDVLPFSVDNVSDIYYARCKNAGDSVVLFVDAV